MSEVKGPAFGEPARPLTDALAVALDDLPTDRPWRLKVLEWLDRHHLGQEDLARAVGISQSSVSNILKEENRGFMARHQFVPRIAHATGLGLPVTARMELAVRRLVADGHLEQAASFAIQIEALVEHLERS